MREEIRRGRNIGMEGDDEWLSCESGSESEGADQESSTVTELLTLPSIVRPLQM